RQPAEGRARALAPAQVPRAPARRADARRRRRRQGGDLPADRRAREVRRGGRDGLVGGGGARRPLLVPLGHARRGGGCRVRRRVGDRLRAARPRRRAYGFRSRSGGGMSTTARSAPRLSLKAVNYQDYGLVGVVVLILIVGGILEDSFLTEDNMLNVLRQG